MADAVLHYLVGGNPDGVLEVLGLEELVDLGRREGGIATEVPPERPVAVSSHDWLENFLPAIGAVHVAGTKGAPLQVTELVEHELTPKRSVSMANKA